MAAIRDILAYFLKHYPHKNELSNARVTKMVYLADWRHAIEVQRQITLIQWIFDNYGPFVWDIKNAAEAEPQIFGVESASNYYGNEKTILSLRDGGFCPVLGATEQAAADHVIAVTKSLGWDAFIKLVYSTYPILRSSRFSPLDLIALAVEYNRDVRNRHPAVVK